MARLFADEVEIDSNFPPPDIKMIPYYKRTSLPWPEEHDGKTYRIVHVAQNGAYQLFSGLVWGSGLPDRTQREVQWNQVPASQLELRLPKKIKLEDLLRG